MRNILPSILELGRKTDGHLATTIHDGCVGMFHILGPCGQTLRIISSGTGEHCMGWEHVSISLQNRCPNWIEMCFVKNLFWDEEEAVMQLHPPKSDYVNIAKTCLHLWKPINAQIPLPPSIMVGPKATAA